MEKIKSYLQNPHTERIVAIFSFVFAFICLLMLISQIYYFSIPKPDKTQDQNNTNIQPPPKDNFFRGLPKDSPFMLTFYLIGFAVSLLSGTIIYSNLHKKEKNIIKSKVVNEMLLPEEKLIIELLEKNNGELTQKELTIKSNFNKLKVSRLIKRLESLNIISKYPYGMTNNIKLNT